LSKNFEFGSLYTVSFSPKELFYRFFKRKKCPICQEKLNHSSKSEFNGYTHMEKSGSEVATLFDDEVKEYTILTCYYCENCNLYFSLSELANWKE
ncbi:MAG: hypothetical protein K2L19_00215, partial [Eubacterium sp.]|nr:hypothetical protein [Eubacterium sp.]